MVDEDIQDLKVLLELLLLKDEYLYTCTLNKIKLILETIVIDKSWGISEEVVDYEDLKLSLYLDLKVGINSVTRQVRPPYRISYSGDISFNRKTYMDRFINVLATMDRMQLLYGALK